MKNLGATSQISKKILTFVCWLSFSQWQENKKHKKYKPSKQTKRLCVEFSSLEQAV